MYIKVSNKIELKDSETENILDKIDNWVHGDYQAKIKAYLQKILDELQNLNEVVSLKSFIPIKSIS